MVNVDAVYQKVLALANKEQRGYITPQEFNLFASQAQIDIFEQYFYDRAQFGRIPGNDTMYADPIDILEEKIEIFHDGQTLGNGTSNIFDTNDLNNELYRLKQVRYNRPDGVGVKIEKTVHDKFMLSRNSPLIKPTLMRPSYYLRSERIVVFPTDIKEIDVNYIRKPKNPQWNGFDAGQGLLYNSDISRDFELHPSEEPNLVLNILKLAGIAMKDASLYQLGAAEEAKDIQQEKQ
jgi:hypothetical protein